MKQVSFWFYSIGMVQYVWDELSFFLGQSISNLMDFAVRHALYNQNICSTSKAVKSQILVGRKINHSISLYKLHNQEDHYPLPTW